MIVGDEIEIKRGDEWHRATVQSIDGNVFTAVLQELEHPITQRLITQEGVTWREIPN